MIRITSYPVTKNNGTSTTTTNGYANSVTNVTTGVQGVNIWGQWHDHQSDVSGDMTGVGNISSNGNITTTGNVNANNVSATGNVTSNKVMTGDINSTGNITTSGTIHADGNITTDENLYADNAYITNNITSDSITANSGDITDLLSQNIVCENLTVTKAAHFFKLIIDEIKAAKGQIIVTPANAKIDKVTFANNKYNLYFRANDADGNQIHNMFEVGDQIVCQTFDAAEGVSYNVSNKFYWSLCSYVSTTPSDQTIDDQTVPCHMIQLDWTDKDTNTNGIPEVGDEIVMLGSRTDTTRQAAISIGAYNNPYLDNTIKAPFIIQYQGINDYNLSSHRGNVISNGYNSFKGVFTTTTGDNIEDLIDDVSEGALTYMHTAYANSANGQMNFSKTYFANAYYIGFCSNHTQSDASLVYTDYTWCRLRGSNGINAMNYILESDSMSIHVNGDGTITDSDFQIRGYELNEYGKTQLNNHVRVTYVLPTSSFAQVYTLPFTLSPTQDAQTIEMGLKKITLQMYNEDEDEFVAQLEIPVLRDGADGQDGDDGDADALEEYKLVPIAETVPIDKNGTLGVQLQYNIIHIIGDAYQYATATSNMCVYFRPHYRTSTSTYTALSINTTTPSYTNGSFQQNWNTTTNKLNYLEIILASANPDMASQTTPTIYDKRVVYAALAPSATFEITDSIISTVQGHTQDINGLTNSITTIEQAFDAITLTVESHTSSINSMQTSISNITQQADSIEATVKNLRTGAKNLFNFTNCVWTDCVPFIQGYGIEGKGTLTRISNLGTENIGGDFAVSCWMKMKNAATYVDVNFCDVNDPEQQTVRVTTSWKFFQFNFYNVSRFISPDSFNGFIDFESNDISNSNRLYVRELMIVRGNIPCDFTPSWKDYEYANTDNIIDWTYNSNIAPTDEKYKGYVIYQPTQYNTTDGTYTDFIFANSLQLKTDTPYTLSFYAMAQHPCKIESYLSGNGGCVDGTLSAINPNIDYGQSTISNLSDGYTASNIGDNWQHYIIHFYNQKTGNRNLICYRDSIDNWEDTTVLPNLSIAGMEFKEGYWDKELLNSQSLIRQTATEIELKVQNTGINIQEGIINLTSENTNINGNLNINNPNQGLILYDQYGNPKITVQNNTLGNLDDFDFGADKFLKTSTTSNVNSTIYNVTFPTITLGNYAAGQRLEIHDIVANTYNVDYYFDTRLVALSFNYTIKCGNTTVATQSGFATQTLHGYQLADYTNNSLTNSGTYTIEVHITGTLYADLIGDYKLKYGQFNHTLNLYARVIQTAINKIAIDGGVFASSIDKYNWFGSDQTMLRNGASAIRLKDGRLQRNEYNSVDPFYNDNFMDLTTCVPVATVNALTYNATLSDGMIVMSSVIGQADTAQRIIYLPNPINCAGKKFYVKNQVGNNTVIMVYNASSSDKYFIGHSSIALVNSLSIGNHAATFISDGFNWMEFY